MGRAELTVERLAPRRNCILGAKQTLESVKATLENGEDLELVKRSLEGQVDERLELLELALRQWDQAMAGDEPDAVRS